MITEWKRCSFFPELWTLVCDLSLAMDNGAEINKANFYGRTPLMIAVETSHIDTVIYLLKHSACPNRQCMYGLTSLHKAKNVEVARVLLDSGCNFNLTDAQYRTAKMEARIEGRHDIANLIELYESVPIKEPAENILFYFNNFSILNNIT
jgi:ankyrin repeat protein